MIIAPLALEYWTIASFRFDVPSGGSAFSGSICRTYATAAHMPAVPAKPTMNEFESWTR